MSQLCFLHNFPLTALNEDFVKCISAITGFRGSTANTASMSSQNLRSRGLSHGDCFRLQSNDNGFLLSALFKNWLPEPENAPIQSCR